MISYELATARTWAEIDVDNILFNYHNALREHGPSVHHFLVLKANAYGLGAEALAKILYAEGARLFAVACVAEALELAKALPGDAQILVMGETFPPEMELSLRHGIISTVSSLETAKHLSETAGRLNVTARIHCKVDTGLNRFGFIKEEAVGIIAELTELPNLRFEGLFSHLQRRSRQHDVRQAERLIAVRDALAGMGIETPMLHLLDSIGMWRYPDLQFDAVRDGAFILGHTPQDYPRPECIRFALSLKTRVVRVSDIEAGECLGYDADHPLEKRTRVATLSIGYADGYPRAMSHLGQAEIHGKRARVLGVVCMDMVMVDVTEIPDVTPGDIATMLGGSIGIFEYAGFTHGYANEYMALLSRRVPRIYIKDGNVIEIKGYLYE